MYIMNAVIAAIMVILFSSVGWSQFYYGSNGQIPLRVDSNKVTIKFDETFSPQNQGAILDAIDRIVYQLEDENMIDRFVACSLSTGDGLYDFLDSLIAVPGIYLAEPYYLSVNDNPVVAGEHFCVAFDTNLTYAEIESLNDSLKVDIDHELYGMPKVYLLKNTDRCLWGATGAYVPVRQTVKSVDVNR